MEEAQGRRTLQSPRGTPIARPATPPAMPPAGTIIQEQSAIQAMGPSPMLEDAVQSLPPVAIAAPVANDGPTVPFERGSLRKSQREPRSATSITSITSSCCDSGLIPRYVPKHCTTNGCCTLQMVCTTCYTAPHAVLHFMLSCTTRCTVLYVLSFLGCRVPSCKHSKAEMCRCPCEVR